MRPCQFLHPGIADRCACVATSPFGNPNPRGYTPPMAKLVLDLHDIFNRGGQIDSALNNLMHEAIDKKISLVEIIPGKGSGVLKERVLKFLQQKHIKALYHRVEKDSKNFGRIFVHFRH